jgi:hypothetical protein
MTQSTHQGLQHAPDPSVLHALLLVVLNLHALWEQNPLPKYLVEMNFEV